MTNAEFNASAPFDDPDADLIVRSSEGTNFRVFKTILATASPVFKSMLRLPQPSEQGKAKAGLPVVSLSEPSAVLDRLLRFCYPCASPRLELLPDIVDVLLAAKKYEVEALTEQVRVSILLLLDSNPVGAYAVACIMGSEDIARQAARKALSIPRDDLLDGEHLALEHVTGAAFQRLLVYHRDASRAAATFVRDTDHSWLPETVATGALHNPRLSTYLGSAMFKLYRERVGGILQYHPCGAAVRDAQKLWPLVKDSSVEAKHRFGEYWALQTYADLLGAKVDGETEQVSLQLSF